MLCQDAEYAVDLALFPVLAEQIPDLSPGDPSRTRPAERRNLTALDGFIGAVP